jgi:hypothetical protein
MVTGAEGSPGALGTESRWDKVRWAWALYRYAQEDWLQRAAKY